MTIADADAEPHKSIIKVTKVTAERHGCPSLASYVAMLLESAPETTTAQQLIQCYRINIIVTSCRRRAVCVKSRTW